MGKIFNYDNLFFRVTGKIGDLFILNLMWLIGCLPVITIGASTLALNVVVEQMQNGEEGYLCRDFWNTYKKQLRRGILLEICLIVSGTLILLSVRFWAQLHSVRTTFSGVASICYVVSMVVLFVYMLVIIYVFQVMLHKNQTILQSMGTAFVVAAQNFPKTLLILLILVSVSIVCWLVSIAFALFLCIGVSGMCYMIVFLGPWHEKRNMNDSNL